MKRERDWEKVCVCMYVCVSMCVYVCVDGIRLGSGRESGTSFPRRWNWGEVEGFQDMFSGWKR